MYSKVKKPRYILQSIGRFKTIITSASVNWRPLLHKSSCPRCLSRTGTIWSSGGTLDACSEKTACPREHFVLYLLLLLSQSLRSCCLTGPLLPLETAVLSADLFMDSSPEIFIRVTAIYCLYDCPNEYKSVHSGNQSGARSLCLRRCCCCKWMGWVLQREMQAYRRNNPHSAAGNQHSYIPLRIAFMSLERRWRFGNIPNNASQTFVGCANEWWRRIRSCMLTKKIRANL